MTQETPPIDKALKIKTSVDLIFPLQTEITIEIAKIPSYISPVNGSAGGAGAGSPIGGGGVAVILIVMNS